MRAISFILDIKKEVGDKPLVGVEIGVYRGEHAELMLQHLNIQRLYLIDPYVDNDSDFEGHMKSSVPAAKAIARKRLEQPEPYEQIIWIEKKSEDALREVCLALDFVYIDGNHSYKYVMRDMIYYGRMVKRGGWIGGHDYMMRRSPRVEVKQAVDDYVVLAMTKGHELHVGEGKFPDWWFRK